MVNNSAKFIALGTVATVGVLGLVSKAQAQHFVYPQELEKEEMISYVDWDSNPGPRAFERKIRKVVFECIPQADGTFATEERVVLITFNPANAAPVDSTFDPHSPYSDGVYSREDISDRYIALGELTGQPMIIWDRDNIPSSNPEGEYSSQSRCETVSARLTNLAYSLGETTPVGVAQAFTERMATGIVNGERVLFISYDPEKASDENVVLTLKPGEGATFAEAQAALAQFNYSVSGSIGAEETDPNKVPPILE